MLCRKEVMLLLAVLAVMFSLLASSALVSADVGESFVADSYIYWIAANSEKNTFGFNESIPISGVLKRANISNTKNSSGINQTGYYTVGENFTLNISVLNSSSNNTFILMSQVLVNTTGSGAFRTKSDSFPNSTPVYAPEVAGTYTVRVEYNDTENRTLYRNNLDINVFSQVVDKVFLSTDKSKYYQNEGVVITASAYRDAGDSLIPVSNITINGTLRRKHSSLDVIVTAFSCVTGSSGSCSSNISAPSSNGKYTLEVNSFVATTTFHVVPFDASAYIKDATGTSFKDILSTNEQAAIEVRVTRNGTTANGTFVFNGTITDSGGGVVANITSTTLNDTNNYVNRFQFTTSNLFTEGFYKASAVVYEAGTANNVTVSVSFQIRGWTMFFTKASDNSGFEYEHTAFPGRNVTFEIYPKERSNGTLISVLNNTHFNATLYTNMMEPIETANVSFNSTCGTTGCYKFTVTTPGVAGNYIMSVSLNFSGVIQSAERNIKVNDLTASAYPGNQLGALKELFSTTEFIYVSVSAKNTSSSVNVTNVTIGSVIYENGTEMNYTRVYGWGSVDSNNSALEWSFNESASRVMLDAPKQGGAYSVKLFVNNNSASASTSFVINPYDACASAKSAGGTIDSSSSWYVWQYKTTDTVYIELKVSRAENPAGRAAGENSTAYSSQYGMGYGCFIDTTKKQVITNATITVDRVVNLQSNAKQALNTTATVCSADNDQGQYTCTIKAEKRWDGGRHMVFLKLLGPDGQTTDKATTIFEARSFYMWAYANNYAWVQKPVSNITFNVRIYEAGSSWWSNWYSNSQNGGISGSVSAERVNYMGDYGEWIWPPIDYKYNITGINSSNVSNGWGSFSIYHDRTPKQRWQPGTYSVTIKGTNDATGENDYGEAWFSVRQWEAYSTPIDDSYNYKNSFSSKENVTLYVRIYNAGDWSDSGGTSLGGNVTVGVKKIQFYQAGSYKELNSSLYSVLKINVNTSSPWYWGASNTYRGHIMNISRTAGSWDGGWYSVILDINGTETGYGWFNVIPFNVDTQPTNANGTYQYTSTGTNPVYFNVSTTKSRKNSYSWYSRGDYINTTVKDIVLRTWKSDTWESLEFNYPEDINISPMSVNGTALIAVNKSAGWEAGYYYGEIIMADSENSTASGYLWFSIQPFRLSASTVRYTVDIDGNASVNLNVYEPDWNNNNIVAGNYTVMSVTEQLWSGSGYSKIAYTDYKPGLDGSFNGSTILNITPNNNAWSLANGGYRYLTIKVNNSAGTSQTTSVSFRVVSVAVSIGSITNQYAITKSQNVTIPITITKASSGAGTTGNLSRIYEWLWPSQIDYNYSVGSCNSATTGTCMINSTSNGGVNGSVTQNVTLIAPPGGWSEGWHSLNLDFTTATDRSQKVEGGYTWFYVANPYTAYWYNEDENASWKYYFSFTDNITLRLEPRNSSYGCGNARVNVSKIEVAYDNNCWSDYCRKWYEYSFVLFNQSASWLPANSISVGGRELNCTERRGIRILHNGTNWNKGYHAIRVTVNGSQGEAVLKTGYFYAKDTSTPNATIISPAFNSTINGSLYFNATTNEPVQCYVTLINYDYFTSWYCWGLKGNASNTSVDTATVDYRACNSASFNGSNYYNAYVNRWGYDGGEPGYSFTTGGMEHTFNFSISKLPATQDYGIDIWCYDEDWNYVNRKTAFRVNVSNTSSSGGGGNATNATAGFNVTLESPEDNTLLSSGQINFLYKLNHSSGNNNVVANCTLYTNFTGSWAANATNMTATISNNSAGTDWLHINLSVTHNTEGTYKWGALCNATNATAKWSSTNRTFTIQDAASNVTLSINQTEANGTVFTTNSASVTVTLHFNVSVSVVSNLKCSLYTNHTGSWASNITNNTVTGRNNNYFDANFTANGTYLWNAYCTNSTETAWGQNRTISVTVNNGTVLPVIVINQSDANGTSFSNRTSIVLARLRFNVSMPVVTNLNCTLYTNLTGAWAANITVNVSSKTDKFVDTNFTGNYSLLWNLYCTNGTNNAWGQNRTIAVSINNDSTGLTINQTIANGTLFTNNSGTVYVQVFFNLTISVIRNLNCSLYTNSSGSWAINITNNISSKVNSYFAANYSSNSTHLWNIYCTNATHEAWGANRTFKTTVNNGTLPDQTANMTINLTSPADSAIYSTNKPSLNVSFIINASILPVGVVNCSLYTNYTSAWAANNTITMTSKSFNTSLNVTTNGTFLWNVNCVNQTQSAWGSSNRTFMATVNNGSVTSANITVTLMQPENSSSTYSSGSNVTFQFNWTGTDVETVNCSLYTNFTSSWAANVTVNGMTSASYTWGNGVLHNTAGMYKWNVNCINSTDSTISGWAVSNRTIVYT